MKRISKWQTKRTTEGGNTPIQNHPSIIIPPKEMGGSSITEINQNNSPSHQYLWDDITLDPCMEVWSNPSENTINQTVVSWENGSMENVLDKMIETCPNELVENPISPTKNSSTHLEIEFPASTLQANENKVERKTREIIFSSHENNAQPTKSKLQNHKVQGDKLMKIISAVKQALEDDLSEFSSIQKMKEQQQFKMPKRATDKRKSTTIIHYVKHPKIQLQEDENNSLQSSTQNDILDASNSDTYTTPYDNCNPSSTELTQAENNLPSKIKILRECSVRLYKITEKEMANLKYIDGNKGSGTPKKLKTVPKRTGRIRRPSTCKTCR